MRPVARGAIVALVALFIFVNLAGCGEEPAGAAPPSAALAPSAARAPKHPVHIDAPAGPPLVDSGLKTFDGRPAMVQCATCHTTRTPDPATRTTQQLDEFHQGLTFTHGNLACLSCHDSGDYNRLHLADGSAVQFANVMQLCGQCHGPQLRDYQHGAHGGMNGYWDLTRGPRTRNNCIQCHDPHSPAYPLVTPAFPPADRATKQRQAHAAAREGGHE